MIRCEHPEISIGLPVYNGARYLPAAIEAILAQTFRDLELVICDNASSDDTQAICERFAGLDRRVRYVRQPRNLGASPNFNHCVELARGRYFKWAAHDDLIDPPFLERCLEALERNPEVVLCSTRTRIIDAEGSTLQIYDPARLNTASHHPIDRFVGRLRTTWCKEVFGVMRTEVLKDTVLLGGYPASDEILLAELALCGRFIILPEPLFRNREHPERSTRGVRVHEHSVERQRWFVTEPSSRPLLPTWTLYGNYLDLLRRYVPRRRDRVRCYVHLLGSLVGVRAVTLVAEPLVARQPKLLPLVNALIRTILRVRRRFGPQPSLQRR